tara:strand:+ start:294 stop:437 length:144 start_codon:yes stop_codon:yes gene_type:complete
MYPNIPVIIRITIIVDFGNFVAALAKKLVKSFINLKITWIGNLAVYY